MTIETSGLRPPTRYAPPLVSWEDFLDWALTIEGRAEWVDGEIIELMPESLRNFDLIEFLIDLLKSHVRRHSLGRVYFLEILMRLTGRPSGRMPDIMFVANEHLNRRRNTYLDGPADLVVEVVSRDSEKRDRHDKLSEYADARIREYWLIDEPRREAHFYVLGEDGRYHDMLLSDARAYESTVLPGLRLKVEWLWRDPLPTLDEVLAELG